MTQKAFTVLKERGVLAVGGEERQGFLQGLVSNDMGDVSSDRAVYTAFLTPQGKYLHDFFVVEVGDEFLIECEGGDRLADLKRRLTMYKLRAKVTVEDRSEDFAVIALWGEGAAEAVGLDGVRAGQAAEFAGGVAFVDPRLATAGARLVVPTRDAFYGVAGSGFAEAPFEDYDLHRIRLGLPDGSRDLTVEGAILLENNFEELNGVSFDKGCYMGQELTSRTKHRGLVRKRLMPVEIDGPVPEPDAPLMLGEKKAGKMRSACGNLGLALVRLEEWEEAEGGVLACGDAKLTPRKPDWANF